MKIEVVDLFCGVGGLTCGLNQSGLKVKAGFDIEKTCKFPYEFNNNAKFYEKDIRNVTGEDINKCYSKNSIRVLAGCAPCQPFSQMSFKYQNNEKTKRENDKRYDLLLEFGRLVKETQPDIVSMENVPKIRDTYVFQEFLKILEENGYKSDYKVVYCPDYGIPQNRRRFLLLAAKNGNIKLLDKTHTKDRYITVRDTIENLPHVEAGEICPSDILHQTAKLSDLNLKRIRTSKPGGSWKDWPKELRCDCHKKESGQTYTSVYGRMEWDKISPTMTTQFYCYGTGRYGHPEQDRALTLREGALIQTFPINYQFVEPGKSFALKDIAKEIGNAVPVKLGEVIGKSIKQYLKN
jgi:DNA (cytosine-5)-methyltransferase 1